MDIEAFIKIDLHIFSVLICAIMLFADAALSSRGLLQNRIFRGLIIATMVTLMADLLGVYSDGRPELYIFSYVVETLLYVISPVAPFIWALYVSYQLFQDIRRLRIEMRVFAVFLLVNTVLALLSPVYGLMFSINTLNVFSRGPFFFVLYTVSFLPPAYAFVMCIVRRSHEALRTLAPMLLFPLPVIGAAVMQIIFYGISAIWPGVALGIFIIYVSIQARQYTIDPLTGAFNRRQLDYYLAGRIKGARRGKPFSCIMLDINHFKAINDAYGHVVGDEALSEAAQVLRSCIRSDDFLSRYAGDEFVILLDVADKAVLEATVARIHASTAQYNKATRKPFRLSFSVGYEIYDGGCEVSQDRFIAHVDSLMYGDKYSKKQPAAD